MIDVFISYAREDEEIAKDLFLTLKASGFRPWLDKENLLPGMNWEREIENAIRRSDVQIFILSPRSVGKRGVFQREIKIAEKKTLDILEDDIAIIPYRVESCIVPDTLSRYQWIEHSSDDRHTRLIRALAKAAEQRGLFEDNKETSPVVVDYDRVEHSSEDGRTNTSYYVPKVKFPNSPELSQQVNALLLGSVSGSIMRFKSGLEDGWREGRTIPDEFHTNVQVAHLSAKFLCAVSDTYEYIGGAHGVSYRRTFNVDIDTGAIFSIYDLFEDYLAIIEAVQEEIDRTGERPIVEGHDLLEAVIAALKSKSLFDDSGLYILFDDYDIFAYAFGRFEVFVPFQSKVWGKLILTELGHRVFQESAGHKQQ